MTTLQASRRYTIPSWSHKTVAQGVVWAFIVFIELVEPHTYGDKLENQWKLDLLQPELDQ